MKRVLLFFTLITIIFAPRSFCQKLEYGKVYVPTSKMSADEIMMIMYHNKYSLFAQDYKLPDCQILYVDKSGFTRKRLAERLRIIKGGQDDIAYKDLISVTYPTAVKGLAILTWTYQDSKKSQDTWLWIPSLKKVRKISASSNDDAFMGSDFTVEEVSTRGFDDETYKLIGEENFKGYTFEHTGELKFEGKPCFVIECIPVKPHWYYSKRIVWVDKDTGGVIFEEYLDRKEKLFKTIFREWGRYDPKGKNYPQQSALECKDLRTGHKTVIINDNEEYDTGISEQNFTVKALMRSRW